MTISTIGKTSIELRGLKLVFIHLFIFANINTVFLIVKLISIFEYTLWSHNFDFLLCT